jgi:hypothetical protein
MTHLKQLFESPELFPLRVDFETGTVRFARMSRTDYRESTFLGMRAAERLGLEQLEIRLDDILLYANEPAGAKRRTHYILHTAYCCSTLLARCFELVPTCLVLKEPQALAELALQQHSRIPRWDEACRLCIDLLARRYVNTECVLIKTNVPCNTLAVRLLQDNPFATITFLMTPLRNFLLAALKWTGRRKRIRYWNRCLDFVGRDIPALQEIRHDDLTDAQAAAYSWLVNRHLCKQLLSRFPAERVTLVNGDALAREPLGRLAAAFVGAGIRADNALLASIAADPSLHKYSKNLNRPYDGAAREQDLATLESRFGREAHSGVAWAEMLNLDQELLQCP